LPTPHSFDNSMSMNLRHAAALALVGWYLLLTPWCGHAQTHDESGDDWRETGPSTATSSEAPDSDSRSELRAKPLQLLAISFLNTAKTGSALSGATDSFDVSKVQFVGWEVSFENRLYKLELGQYRVDAVYIGPDGRTFASINDFQPVSPSMRTVTFRGQVGNSRGGAFRPGAYTVNFYLNGQYFGLKKFQVLAADGSSSSGGVLDGSSSSGGVLDGSSSSGGVLDGSSSSGVLGPTIGTGTISGLRSGGNPEMELRLRPQSNGFLHGELVIHQTGFGMTPLDGYVRGDHLQFQVPYGSEVYYFEGARRNDQISGTFESTPSNDRGTWSVRAN
jgi:hypothetical protein